MREYYRLCRLQQGQSIHAQARPLHVDLDAARGQPNITRDELIAEAISPETYFWLSGGGSLLVEGRYLLVVKRSPGSRVNPGKLSLFTGRADNEDEWRQPRRLLRELFEELILLNTSGHVRVPDFPTRWVDAGTISRAFSSREGYPLAAGPPTSLGLMPLSNRRVRITSGQHSSLDELLLHVSDTRDINVLFVLTTALPLADIWALDGEADGRPSRAIFALDVMTMTATNVTYGLQRTETTVDRTELTEHCRFLLDLMRERVNKDANKNHC